MASGKFFALEGIDGAGKSTLIKALEKKMTDHGKPCHVTAEPTKNHIGKTIRAILTGEMEGDEKTIAALFLADRIDHLTHKEYGMLQYINNGVNVISDRYYLSSYAYHVPHVSLDWVIEANSICAALKRPDITFFIDITVEESLRRLSFGRQQLDRFENENRISTVRKNYMQAIDRVKDQENIIIINGYQTMEQLAEEVWQHMLPLISC